MAAGDSVGATPPISNSFGDTPTMEIMNLMGIDIDGLGNHNFDRGADYLRNTLIPIANFPFVSANVVDSAGNTPPEWSKSHVFDIGHGITVGFVGFTNDDAPTLTKPGAFDPFVVPLGTPRTRSTPRPPGSSDTTNAIVAMGHYGATGGTLTEPDRPAGRPRRQRLERRRRRRRPHRFPGALDPAERCARDGEPQQEPALHADQARDRPGRTGVVYKTADFHKPWNIGLTPDRCDPGEIDELNAQLLPILGTTGRRVQRGRAAQRRLRRHDGPAGWPCLRVARRRHRHRRDAAAVRHGLRHHQLRRAPGQPDLPDDGQRDGLLSVGAVPVRCRHFPITRGQVLAVLPFGNQSATANVDGVLLKEFLETAVSPPPNATIGRFGQVSGLCVEYNVEAPAKQFDAVGDGILGTGSRVMAVVRQAPTARATSPPARLSALTPETTTRSPSTTS